MIITSKYLCGIIVTSSDSGVYEKMQLSKRNPPEILTELCVVNHS
jgi:hypothetical protein